MKIEIREVDDWTALYVDGELVHQNHSIRLREGLELLGIPFESHYYEDDDYNEITIQFPDGSEVFPERLPDA